MNARNFEHIRLAKDSYQWRTRERMSLLCLVNTG